ncbi:YbbR-like protein [Clostridiales bacterium oral taxon 876 str. F0540]|nr:YbbR-like protein [Clostridiales bacterium oral taxon 876 str. F0540]
MDKKNTWLIKVCCVIAAFSLWLYTSNLEGSQVPQQVKVQVTLQGLDNVTEQKLKVLPPSEPYTVTLKVTGSLTDVQLGKEQFKAVADLSEWVFTKGERDIPVRIERQPANVTILNSSILSIRVAFDDLKQKSLPIKVNTDGKVKDGYYAMTQNLTPSDAVVSGAAKYVDQVASVGVSLDLKNADKDLNLKLPLKALDSSGREVKNVDITPDAVELSIPVRKTKTVGISVVTKGNLGKDYSLKTIVTVPDKVDIAGGEAVNNITELKTEAVDLSTLSPNKTITAKLVVPEGINLINSDGTVKIKATMDKIIQNSYSSDIQVKGLNDAFTIALDNSKLTLTLSGPESIISTIKNENINANIDVSSLSAEGEYSVKVNYAIPDGTSKISANVENVKVILKKKAGQNTSTPTTTQPTNTQTNGGQ